MDSDNVCAGEPDALVELDADSTLLGEREARLVAVTLGDAVTRALRDGDADCSRDAAGDIVVRTDPDALPVTDADAEIDGVKELERDGARDAENVD